MIQNIFIVNQEDVGKRLDVFLSSKNIYISRNLAQKEIKNKKVVVNNTFKTPNYKIKYKDEIKIYSHQKNKNNSLINKQIKNKNCFKIVAESPEYIIIDKPAGLIVHGNQSIKLLTLVDFLIKKYPEIKNVGDDPLRPGIVHRLDKDVSGLMIIAKTPTSFENLKNQFKKRLIKKEYLGLVYGKIFKDYDIIKFPLKRSSSGHKISALPILKNGQKNLEGKRAITEFNVLKKMINFTFLSIKIKTGRTHQIRAHLSAYGHPLVGDNLYGTPKTKRNNKKIGIKRIFLMSHKLIFKNLSGEKVKIELPLSKDLKHFLKKLK